MEESYEIKMKCLFCKSEDFEIPEEGYHPEPGEMIKCANCGKLNDYESMCKVAKEKGITLVEKEAVKEIEDRLKKTFKDINIKF